MLIVIGTAPTLDVSVAVGPFHSEASASVASHELTLRGYNAEICVLSKMSEIDTVSSWEES